jgi:hypothetical protein
MATDTSTPSRRTLLRVVAGGAALAPVAALSAPLAASLPNTQPLDLSPRFAVLVGDIDGLMAENLRLRSTIADDGDYEDASDPLYMRRHELECEIGKTPPMTIGDVIAKLRILAHPTSGIDDDGRPDNLSVRLSLGWIEQAAATMMVARTGEVPTDPLLALAAERRGWLARANAAETDDDLDRFSGTARILTSTMLGLPAISIAGAVAKIGAAHDAHFDELDPEGGPGHQLMISALADLDRLAGGVS